jgi:asparagine synthetase B (glutamine-hydrolysing)
MAVRFGVPYELVRIPRKAALEDAAQLIKILDGETKKTHIECSLPFKYMAQRIAEKGFNSALFGMSADDLYGTSKNAAIALSRSGESGFREYRKQSFGDLGASDYSVIKVAKHFGVRLIDPYRDRSVSDFVLSLSSRQINRPKPKALAVRAFPEFWRCGAWYRSGNSLQVVSGIREFFDTLLGDRKSAVSLFRDLKNGL